MKLLAFIFLVCFALALPESIYDFEVRTADGEIVSLETFSKYPVLLIVNVACACGYTAVNYTELQALYNRYNDRGLMILAFPCNQFGNQEPGAIDEIKEYVTTNFDITFTMMDKIEVNGSDAHPLFRYLKRTTDTKEIEWNFTKYLVNGNQVRKFYFNEPPLSLEEHIVHALEMIERVEL